MFLHLLKCIKAHFYTVNLYWINEENYFKTALNQVRVKSFIWLLFIKCAYIN